MRLVHFTHFNQNYNAHCTYYPYTIMYVPRISIINSHSEVNVNLTSNATGSLLVLCHMTHDIIFPLLS